MQVCNDAPFIQDFLRQHTRKLFTCMIIMFDLIDKSKPTYAPVFGHIAICRM